MAFTGLGYGFGVPTFYNSFHTGIDYLGEFGTPVPAAAAGTVTKVQTGCPTMGFPGSTCGDGWGNSVFVDAGNGWQTVYGHLEEVDVQQGDTIFVGQQIGLLGDSGNSTGAHTHYETDLNGVPQNPDTSPFPFNPNATITQPGSPAFSFGNLSPVALAGIAALVALVVF